MVRQTATALAQQLPLHFTLMGTLKSDSSFRAFEALHVFSPTIVWSRDKTRLLARAADGTLLLWKSATSTALKERPSLTIKPDTFTDGFAFSPDSSRILTWHNTSKSGYLTVRVWDADSGAQLLELTSRNEGGYPWSGARWNGDGTRILTWTAEGRVEVRGAASGKRILALGPTRGTYGAFWNPDETRILTWSSNDAAIMWDASDGKYLFSLPHVQGVWDTTWSRDGRRILTGGLDGLAGVWDSSDGTPLLLMRHGPVPRAGGGDPKLCLWQTFWSGDERRVFTINLFGKLSAWDLAVPANMIGLSTTGPSAVLELPGPAQKATANFDGSRVIVQSGQKVILWDTVGGKTLLTADGALDWSADQRLMAVWDEYSIRIYSVASGQRVAFLAGSDRVLGTQWLDKRHLLCWSADGAAQLWRGETQASNISATPRPIPEGSLPSVRAGNTGAEKTTLQVQPGVKAGQLFVADTPQLSSVEIRVKTDRTLGDTLTLEISWF
jgi:WD40 repeat protein